MSKRLRYILTAMIAPISGVLYRMGGSDNFNTKWRDIGVSICVVACLSLLGFFHWVLLIVFGLQFGSLTTYFKKKGSEARYWNWAIVGLSDGLTMAPIAVVYGNWLGFGIRTAVCALLTSTWSSLIGNAVLEENGRGWIRVITLPLLLIK